MTLFSGVGSGTNTANFTNTVFDDNAATPDPERQRAVLRHLQPAGVAGHRLRGPGMNVQGTWTLVIQNNSTTGGTGTFNGWSLTFQKPLPTSGLGEPGSDNASASFRIFTLGPDRCRCRARPGRRSARRRSLEHGDERRAGSARSAIDPSDPSGNTVYAAGASGGIWKTTDFLTTSPNGPTWIPLTDFGPTSASTSAASPSSAGTTTPTSRSSSPPPATGRHRHAPGVGFLISDGRRRDLEPRRQHRQRRFAAATCCRSNRRPATATFVGTTAYKVVVDPKLTPTGQVIIYAAMSGTNGGIWRSEDTGQTWQLMLAGKATDVVLDPNSGTVLNPTTDTDGPGQPPGRLRRHPRARASIMSPNQGQIWNLMTGGIGNPLDRRRSITAHERQPGRRARLPTAPRGEIVLAVPAATGNAAEDPIYEGWLYAAVATPDGGFDGLFVTKDFGQNWTQVRIPTLPPVEHDSTRPSPPTTSASPITRSPADGQFPQGNYDITLAVDPTNPNIIYLGGTADDSQTGLIRVDTTNALGRPLPGRLLRQRQRRRRLDLPLDRPGHGRHATSIGTAPVGILPAAGLDSPVSELHPQPARPVPGQLDPARLQLRQLHQQRRRRRRGSRSTWPGPTTTASSR